MVVGAAVVGVARVYSMLWRICMRIARFQRSRESERQRLSRTIAAVAHPIAKALSFSLNVNYPRLLRLKLFSSKDRETPYNPTLVYELLYMPEF